MPKKSHHKAKSAQETASKRVTVNPLSFHSLRHTAATLLRMTGSSEAVAREIIGHDSASVDRATSTWTLRPCSRPWISSPTSHPRKMTLSREPPFGSGCQPFTDKTISSRKVCQGNAIT